MNLIRGLFTEEWNHFAKASFSRKVSSWFPKNSLSYKVVFSPCVQSCSTSFCSGTSNSYPHSCFYESLLSSSHLWWIRRACFAAVRCLLPDGFFSFSTFFPSSILPVIGIQLIMWKYSKGRLEHIITLRLFIYLYEVRLS